MKDCWHNMAQRTLTARLPLRHSLPLTSVWPWEMNAPSSSVPRTVIWRSSRTDAPTHPTTCPSLGPPTALRPSRPAKVSSAPRCTRTGQSYGRLEDWTFRLTTMSMLSSPNLSQSPQRQQLSMFHVFLSDNLTPQKPQHGQQCNVTYRKPGRDLPGSNPVVSHFFILIILYREA